MTRSHPKGSSLNHAARCYCCQVLQRTKCCRKAAGVVLGAELFYALTLSCHDHAATHILANLVKPSTQD